MGATGFYFGLRLPPQCQVGGRGAGVTGGLLPRPATLNAERSDQPDFAVDALGSLTPEWSAGLACTCSSSFDCLSRPMLTNWLFSTKSMVIRLSLARF